MSSQHTPLLQDMSILATTINYSVQTFLSLFPCIPICIVVRNSKAGVVWCEDIYQLSRCFGLVQIIVLDTVRQHATVLVLAKHKTHAGQTNKRERAQCMKKSQYLPRWNRSRLCLAQGLPCDGEIKCPPCSYKTPCFHSDTRTSRNIKIQIQIKIKITIFLVLFISANLPSWRETYYETGPVSNFAMQKILLHYESSKR